MPASAVTLDQSTFQPIQQQPASGPVSLDMGTFEPSVPPEQSGETLNDVGNTVIVPKEGESYLDTIHRAIAHYQSQTPEQQQDAINREMKPRVIGKKVAQTLAAAPAIGAAGTAALATPGEIVHGIYAGIGALTPAIIKGVQGVGNWAEEHPMAAKFLWESLKSAMTGTAVLAASKIAGKVIKAGE